jgi:hypothetical protein
MTGVLHVKRITGEIETYRFRTLRGAREAAKIVNESARDHQIVYAVVFKEI